MERANSSTSREMAMQAMNDSQYCDYLAGSGYYTMPTSVYITTPPPSLPGSPLDNSKSKVTHMHAGGVAGAAWLTPPPDPPRYQLMPYDGSNDVPDSPSPHNAPTQSRAGPPPIRNTCSSRQARSAGAASPVTPTKRSDVHSSPMLGTNAQRAPLPPTMRTPASPSPQAVMVSPVVVTRKRPSDSELMPPPARRPRHDIMTEPARNPTPPVQYGDVDGRSNTDPSMRMRYGLPLWQGPYWAPLQTELSTAIGLVQSPTMMATLPFGGLIEVAEYY